MRKTEEWKHLGYTAEQNLLRNQGKQSRTSHTQDEGLSKYNFMQGKGKQTLRRDWLDVTKESKRELTKYYKSQMIDQYLNRP